ncbi:hypothetical protein GCM10008959_10350 [Deinococcus seoulensis]|uniref:Uncharacterized protein n=1 Tax=Deinococcus seoulensis TaxID=1837379 RepID=A0ABQ2RQ32_9DEIO|nr:hypothetical protein [Deinococcus seoulensis]GGR50947.1 hypothetical protein GCM10008959_10350 [Deinococcus seoulensis]
MPTGPGAGEAPGWEAPTWQTLGLSRPRALPLTGAARERLAHLTELRDIDSPAAADRAGAEYAGERWLAPDLLGVRPWLPPGTPRREVPGAVLNGEWTGFLALLGEYGPWVYAADVRALQELSGAYAALVQAAQTAPEDVALHAAARSLADAPHHTLLIRLEATPYRRPERPARWWPARWWSWGRPGRQPPADAATLVELERAFWTLVAAHAQDRRAAWVARR